MWMELLTTTARVHTGSQVPGVRSTSTSVCQTRVRTMEHARTRSMDTSASVPEVSGAQIVKLIYR